MDVDAIEPGLDFAEVLSDKVSKCDVLLAIIGSRWLDAGAERGKRRLDSPDDFVRIEIAAALKREIRVIPILLDGTHMPSADHLPEDLKKLALRNGIDVRHASFHSDMERLIRRLRPAEGSVSTPLPASTSAHLHRGQGRIKVDAAIL